MLRKIKESIPWSSKIGLFTFCLAFIFSTLSTVFGEASPLLISLAIVATFIIIGIIADTIGLAAATAKEPHFHALASKKISGAKEATYITKKAPLFSSFFNDVMGDIAGIVSGAASTAVVFQLSTLLQTSEGSLIFIVVSVLLTSLIAALTVGGKALCKTMAIYKSTNIILYTGKVMYFLKKIQNLTLRLNMFKSQKQHSVFQKNQHHKK